MAVEENSSLNYVCILEAQFLPLQLLRLDSSMVRIQDIRFEDFQEEVKVNTAGTWLVLQYLLYAASIASIGIKKFILPVKGEANRLVLVLNVRKRLKARILDYLFELVTKKIDYHLFRDEVEFHREMITSQLQGKLWLYDEVPLHYNDVNTANPAYEVSTVSPDINIVCPQVGTANFSDNTVYAFMVENPNGLVFAILSQTVSNDLLVMQEATAWGFQICLHSVC
ncbi:hypothetical protein Tco_1515157 [Tanacetum coccineum]